MIDTVIVVGCKYHLLDTMFIISISAVLYTTFYSPVAERADVARTISSTIDVIDGDRLRVLVAT